MNALTLNGQVVLNEKMFKNADRSWVYVILAKSLVLKEMFENIDGRMDDKQT